MNLKTYQTLIYKYWYTDSLLKVSFLWPLCEKWTWKFFTNFAIFGCISQQDKRSIVKKTWSKSLKSIFLDEILKLFFFHEKETEYSCELSLSICVFYYC